ncbi:MAG TPA: RodZ domain-containing protein [Chloroflexota bacterium]|nr:RodZ domain-containing protein [Chloroflexota bacterium]
MLRTAREERGVSLAQAEAATMIRRSYLQALEDDEHAQLPGAVYIKGFLRNYAQYLGLDALHVLSVYHREYPDQSQEVVAPATIKPRGTSQLVTGGTIASLLLVVVIAIFSTYVYRQVQAFRQSEPASQAAALVPTPTPIPPTPTSARSAETAAAVVPEPVAPTRTALAGGAEVTAKVSQDAWLQVQVDGQRSFEGVLKAGQTQTWKGKDDVFVWVGNAGGVSIVFNGSDMGTLGAVGEVVKKDFKKV